jgi:hypothetical protein
MFIKLTKLKAAENPLSPPGRWGEYEPGSIANITSLPVDYTMVGILLTRITLGECVRLLRVNRNGVAALGVFQSTPVMRLTGDGFATANSVYRIEDMGLKHAPSKSRASDREDAAI